MAPIKAQDVTFLFHEINYLVRVFFNTSLDKKVAIVASGEEVNVF